MDLSGCLPYQVEAWAESAGLYRVRVTYARVGQACGRPDIKRGVTLGQIENRIREKLAKGYGEVDLHTPIAAVAPIAATVSGTVDQLIRWMFSEAGEQIKTYLKVAVEELSTAQIGRGRAHLAHVQDILRDPAARVEGAPTWKRLVDVVEAYYNAIPTKLPSRIRTPDVVREFVADLNEQETRLQQLEAALTTLTMPGGSQYAALGAQIAPLPQTDPRYGQLVASCQQRHNHNFGITVRDIFTVRIPQERAAYEAEPRGSTQVLTLFHGTRTANVRHILKRGLIVPTTAANGRMFGSGIYLADQSTKSGQYCGSNAMRIPRMLFLADAKVGTLYLAPRSGSWTEPPVGYDSVLGKAGVSGVMNNEYIVYHTSQQTIRFLVTWDRI